MMTSMSDNCKDGVSKSNDDVCDDVNNMLQKLSTAGNEDNDTSACANCGKEGSDINNICNKCKQVKYCNAACKKKHKKKHKKDCEEYIRLAAEKHDEELFKQPPQREDCPICFVRLPTFDEGRRYKTCCGKIICSACCYAPVFDNQGSEVDNQKCPFCRTPNHSTDEEMMEREMKRVEMNDPIAMYNLGNWYFKGTNGYPQDHTKALELWHQAGKLGHALAYNNIGSAYINGIGVKVDEKTATYYYELAAMKGDILARKNLGNYELELDNNMDRALKHYMIAVRDGWSESLEIIKDMYSKGYATKDDYSKALQLYQLYLSEIKSPQRDKAAATYENCHYY